MPSKNNSPTKTQIVDKQVQALLDELRRRLDPIELLSKADVAAALKIDRWTLDRLRKTDASFPPPLWLTPKSARWRPIDVLNWQNARPRGGRSPEWERSALRASKRKTSREARA